MILCILVIYLLLGVNMFIIDEEKTMLVEEKLSVDAKNCFKYRVMKNVKVLETENLFIMRAPPDI